MEAKIKIELEINGKVETITYEDGLAIYNELKKIYDRTITIGGHDFITPKYPKPPYTNTPIVMYGAQIPPGE